MTELSGSAHVFLNEQCANACWLNSTVIVWFERLFGKIIHELLRVNYPLVETHKPYHHLQCI